MMIGKIEVDGITLSVGMRLRTNRNKMALDSRGMLESMAEGFRYADDEFTVEKIREMKDGYIVEAYCESEIKHISGQRATWYPADKIVANMKKQWITVSNK